MNVKLQFTTEDSWSFLWLKYVEGVDLSKHCARSLVGRYSSLFPYRKKVSQVVAELDEADTNLYYLCGVSRPYVYENNLHVAFRKAPGESFSMDFRNTHVVVTNAQRIDIVKEPVYFCKFGDVPEYNTCRNWQFAQMIEKMGLLSPAP